LTKHRPGNEGAGGARQGRLRRVCMFLEGEASSPREKWERGKEIALDFCWSSGGAELK